MIKSIPCLYLLVYLICIDSACSQLSTNKSAENPHEISIHTDFEGGSLGAIEKLSNTHWRCGLAGESDWQNRNRQASWYYFRVDGAKGQQIKVELTDLLGEYNYRSGTHAVTAETRPVISYDQKSWRHLTDNEVTWIEETVELHLHFQPEGESIWIAHQPPYTNKNLELLLEQLDSHAHVVKQAIGKTPEGRDIVLVTVSNDEISLEDKQIIWIMARQHAWESGTSWVMEGILRYLTESQEGTAWLNAFVFKLIPMADPDGVARGGVRFNQYGHDLNRNWDLVKPEEMPEIASQKKAFSEWVATNKRVDFFLTIHNTESSDYLQGPDLRIGKLVWENLVTSTAFDSQEGLRKIRGQSDPGRMTINENLWSEFQTPAYLMELKVEHVDKTHRRRLIPEWLELGKGITKAITVACQAH